MREQFTMNLRLIYHLSRLHHASNFVEGAAALFREDSIPKRVLTGTTKLIWGLDQLADISLTRERRNWHTYTNATVVQDGIKRHGEHVLTLNDHRRDATEVWQIGEHLVSWASDWSPGAISSVSTLDDIARDVLACSLRELGPGARALLSQHGVVADPVHVPESKTSRAFQLIDTLRQELTHQHRTLLLHGPAGSGKTVASRQIADALADSVVVVSSAMVGDKFNNNPFALVCSWRPQAVVFDDLDRAVLGAEGWVLAGIDRVRAVVPLVIATANVRDDFSGALLRPGRFDRIEQIDRLDDAVARASMSSVPVCVRDKAIEEGLLAAYCAELDLRCRCGDPADDAFAEMLERQRRAGDGAAPVGDTSRAFVEATLGGPSAS